jgi:hypothetical protein
MMRSPLFHMISARLEFYLLSFRADIIEPRE